ncbi:hypothetical protein ABIF26_009451 [Bradyrhizobium elkanii]|jgi:hypothetical protein|uniref:hypothetical protein n=1 Tax=Bradyrhizobium elkanii TaxID=29448 RepID=UPI0010203653|nr:hypothetical protein [Bradyrhizobium elkanii]NWL36313.1 hypothetical protein [Bradyrhizobium elkanii]QOZ18466.1 hypothetical protein XI02_28110 [Bradyrhizobium sp. CCBAU 21365]RYM20013.1 hypothetical protein EWH13_32480 [Bradyrhizobium elkanii]WLA88477.1 hypothetical protein QNJ96_25560 [Bradyrhizobium elkanii]
MRRRGRVEPPHEPPSIDLLEVDSVRRGFTLPDLEQKLASLSEGSLLQIAHRDYERLFGTNDAALTRVRNFARSHLCVAVFADHAVLFRKGFEASVNQMKSGSQT